MSARADTFYESGDATRPIGAGAKVIAHICNDIGGWGRGFVTALSKRWAAPERAYREWFDRRTEPAFELGQVQFVFVEAETWVANMIGQHDIKRGGKTADGKPPVRYDAIERALERLAEFAVERGATVHMPRIGCGLAGGSWDRIEPLIQQKLVGRGVSVTVYELPSGSLQQTGGAP